MRYYVKVGSKVDCLMNCAKDKKEVNVLYYYILKILGFDVFKK